MAPIKRSRARTDYDDDDDEGSHSRRRDSHKKARTNAHTDDSDSASDHPTSRRRAQNDNLSMTQHEKNRDADYSHLAHEEEVDARATQKIMARTETLGENRPADNGIIEYVTMGNFMCHVHLHVELGPLINFIIGENGSGKSTILTAITLCLGGKASATNRGAALKDYIKSGEESCKIKVALKNEGIDAYQPDLFGARIIVERTFTRSGSSGFKLQSESGRTVSNKKADLDELVEYFQMQIDNPMNILTQDAARQFLNQATAAQKYKFFIKGVQLEQMDNDYRIVQETCDAADAKLHDRVETLTILKKKMQEADKKHEMVQNQGKVREKMKELRNLCAWSQVEEEERVLAKQEDKLRQAQELVATLQAKAEEKAAEFEQADISYNKNLESVQRTVDDLDQYREKETSAKADYEAAMQLTNRAVQEQRQVSAEMKEAKEKARSYLKQIELEQRRLDNLSGGGNAKRLTDLETTQKKAQDLKRELESKQQETQDLEDAKRTAEGRSLQAAEPIKSKKHQIQDYEAKLKALQHDTVKQMDGFDSKMPQLLRMIAEDRGFKERPVGPMGLHVKLLKPGWSTILERQLSGVLASFIVTSKSDQERLQEMMRRVQLQGSSIVIGNHSQLDTTGNEPDKQYETVLRVLDIDNDLVRRQLIISQSIEQILLIEDMNEADRILFDGPKPAKVKACLTKNPSPKLRGHGLRLAWAGGNLRTQDAFGPNANPRPKMKTTTESQIAEQRENLEYLRKDMHQLEAERRQAEQGVAKCTQILLQHNRAMSDLRIALQRTEDAEERIRDELDKDNVAGGKLEQLKSALEEAKEASTIHENSYIDVTNDRKRHSDASGQAKSIYDEAKAETAAHEFKIQQMKKKLDQKDRARQGALGLKNHAITQIEEAAVVIPKLTSNVKAQEEQVATFIQGASEVCPRVPVPVGKTVQDFEKSYMTLVKNKEEFSRKIGGTDAEIAAQAKAARDTYGVATRQDADFQQLLRRLKQSYFKRIEMWRTFLKHISSRMRVNFAYLLSERGFRGKVRLDHRGKLLELNIEPDETVKSAKGRQTKTLSGGEKSFSSICLLLALWDAMGAPLRCLDEFDVFMDQVNRDVSTGLIIQAARRSVGRQYILITPNAIGGNGGKAKLGDDVKIIRLRDPRQKAIDDMMNGTGANDDSD